MAQGRGAWFGGVAREDLVIKTWMCFAWLGFFLAFVSFPPAPRAAPHGEDSEGAVLTKAAEDSDVMLT